ncbi:hypothetical protein F5Y17DRAFT_185952 [Xylariaceae sp. FL0594]|nr:hypothetical protein F5Y17DRAFT_185952 [Xylariaceae sp. FL0594]
MSDAKSLWRAARNPPADRTDLSFKNKTVVVTGASSGLGYAAALKYAAQGASKLVLGVRTAAKGEKTKAAIVEATGCSPDIFVILPIDLESFESARAFAARLDEIAPEIHVLQLAGGSMRTTFIASADGFESSLQANALTPALLALLLLPKVRATAAAAAAKRDAGLCYISFVNSIAHVEVKPEDVPDPSSGQTLIGRCNAKAQFDFQKQYFLVKLVAFFAMRGVAQRSGGGSQHVVVNATCPGLCKTNMLHELPFIARIVMAVTYFVMGRSAEQGARTMISATGLGVDSHGKFWTNDQFPPTSKLLESERGEELYHETWNEVLTILRPYLREGSE